MDRICSNCGAHFEGRSRDTKCPECRSKQEFPLVDKICKQCGGKYQARGRRSFFCPSCAAERRKAADKRAKSGTKRKLGSVDLCEICGQPYIVNGGLQRFCRECSKARKNEFGLEYFYSVGKERRVNRVKNRVVAMAECIVCGKTFPLNGERSLCCSPECSQLHAENLRTAYRAEHREELREYNRQWQDENRDRRNEQRKRKDED